MKIIHISDIHLDHLNDPEKNIKEFAEFLSNSIGDLIFCTGDNSNAKQGIQHLKVLQENLKKPFYFVNGNHDYYCGSIYSHKQKVIELFGNPNSNFVFLSGLTNPIILDNGRIALIGNDGWYDGRAGEWAQIIRMSDFDLIEELARHNYRGYLLGNKVGLWEEMQKLSRESIDHIDTLVEKAISQQVKKIVILTHVPPWTSASLHEGIPNNPAWAPGFVHYMLGRYLEITASCNPDIEFVVYCGHSHHKACVRIDPNLECKVAFAEYGYPEWSYSVEEI